MKLLVVRHAIAMDRDEFAQTGEADDQRPLTKRGIRRMERNARGLRAQVPSLDHVASSQFTRAVQTARIITDEYGIETPEITDSLVPDAPFEEFERWCMAYGGSTAVAVVGHEPHLSSMIGWFLTSHDSSGIELKKGGACLLEFEHEPKKHSGTMLWLLTPGQLRKMAR